MPLIGSFIAIGCITFLFPLLSAAVYFLSFSFILKGRRKKSFYESDRLSLNILVPAYRESDTLKKTVSSLIEARAQLIARQSADHVTITIGLDGSDDETRAAARSFAGHEFVRVADRIENLGKWKTLAELVSGTTADWSVIVDSGSLWGADFLMRLRPYLLSTSKIGFAPGYEPQNAGLIERTVWAQERCWKKIENLAGGPVSVHGATMVFRTDVLKKTFERLNYRTWLNDDVVIALISRSQGEICYFGKSLFVSDCGIRDKAPEFTRRKRMASGNLEWIKELFPGLVLRHPLVALIACRRLARVYWLYSILASGWFLGLYITNQFYWSFISIPVLLLMLKAHPKLWQAGKASLLAPWLTLKKESKVEWS